MKNFKENKLESIFCGFGYWTMLKWHFSIAQRPKPQKFIQDYFSCWEDTTLTVKGILGSLKMVYSKFCHIMKTDILV